MRNGEWAASELKHRTEFLCRVLEKVFVRTGPVNGKPVEWFRDSGGQMDVMRGGTPVGCICKWEMQAAITALLDRERQDSNGECGEMSR